MADEPEPSDEELTRRARAGDADAANALFARHAAELRARVRRRLPRALRGKVAESDVVQDAYLAAFLGLERFEERGDGSFKGWLGAVLERKLIDEVRRFEGTERRDVGREVAAGTNAERLLGSSGDPSPSSAAIGEEQSVRLAAAMERLPEQHREVLRLVHDEKLPLAEVGARLGRSADAARKLHARAVHSLAVALRESEG